jgi:hypothetical protein
MKNFIFNSFFWISIFLFIPMALTIDVCQAEGYNSNFISDFMIISGFFLMIEVVIYLFDALILLIRKMARLEVEMSELVCFGKGVLLFVCWVGLNACFLNNGRCDLIIGPADSGLCLAMGISILINYCKVQILRKKETAL